MTREYRDNESEYENIDATENQLAEEKRIEKKQRKQFSRVGMAAAAFMAISMVTQIAFVVIAGVLNQITDSAIDFFSVEGLMIISSFSMYLVAFPVAAAFLFLVPKCGGLQHENWGIGRFIILAMIGTGIGFAGSLLSLLMDFVKPGTSDADGLSEILNNMNVWLNLSITVLMAPIVEELFYRKMLIDRLAGFGDVPAILVSGLMFGLAHGNLSQFFYTFPLGLIWGYTYIKTGRIAYTIALHMVFNFLGGVFTLELSKAIGGEMNSFWILEQLEQVFWIDLTEVVAMASAMILLVYVIYMAACMIGGIVLLIVCRKQIQLLPGIWPLKKGRRLRTSVLNVGMLLYFVFCVILFVMTW